MLKSSQMTERLKSVDVYIAEPLFNPEENLHNFDYNLVTNSRIMVVNLNGHTD